MIRVLCAIALMGTSSFAKVVEVSKMASIKDAVRPGTVLVFDIDNTLVEASQMYGSDQWFEHLVPKLADGVTTHSALLYRRLLASGIPADDVARVSPGRAGPARDPQNRAP